jgi:hypothetical protein
MAVYRSVRAIRQLKPMWTLWVETAGGQKSTDYHQVNPLPSVAEMDAAILGVLKTEAASRGAVLYQKHLSTDRLFMHQFKARGKDALFELVNGKWVRRD